MAKKTNVDTVKVGAWMKIGVLSDTHIPGRAKQLPEFLVESLKKVEHIIHAGDIANWNVIEKLEEIAPVTAVAGNADPQELRERLGEKKVAVLGGYRFGIFHGHGEKGKTVDRAIHCFENDQVDCIIFGHSHNPYCRLHGKTLLFNPGSPTDKRRNEYYSFGIIEISETILPRLIYFNRDGTPG